MKNIELEDLGILGVAIIAIIGIFLLCSASYAQKAVISGEGSKPVSVVDIVGQKVDGKTIVGVELKSDNEINADVKKLEEDIPDREKFCQWQFDSCTATINSMKAKLDSLKPLETVAEVNAVEAEVVP